MPCNMLTAPSSPSNLISTAVTSGASCPIPILFQLLTATPKVKTATTTAATTTATSASSTSTTSPFITFFWGRSSTTDDVLQHAPFGFRTAYSHIRAA